MKHPRALFSPKGFSSEVFSLALFGALALWSLVLAFSIAPGVAVAESADPQPGEPGTFLVVMASITNDDEKPPTFIGMRRIHGAIQQLEADAAIMEFPVGDHVVEYIDFSSGVHSKKEKFFGVGSRPFTVREGRINLLGHIELTKTGRRQYDVGWGDTRALLDSACLAMPEAFDSYLVSFVFAEKEFAYRCPQGPAKSEAHVQ